ncbi:MAG: glycerol kinase GlpK [Bdellovibrio sp.]
MPASYIMAIDQGTTGTTVSLMDLSGSLVASADQDFKQIFPRPGWVEHNPDDIWGTVEQLIPQVLMKAQVQERQIAAIGITNQRETVVVWDAKSKKPVMNAIVWQCRRTQEICAKLKKAGYEKIFKKKTGLVLDPYFSGTKIRWILQNVPACKEILQRGDLRAGTIDSFLIWRLSKGDAHVTDVSNASRTLMMDLTSTDWDPQLLKILGVPREMLPTITDSSGILARTKGLGVLPDGIPIAGVAGDQQAALFGQTCWQAGESKCTYGTGSFLLMNTGSKIVSSKSGLLTTVGWRLPRQKTQYALEGGAFVCGAAVQWLRDGLGMIKSSSEIEALANSAKTTDGVEFVPALTGLGAPYWRPEARGTITGLTRGTTRAQIARATLEAMALQNCEILIAMQRDLGKKMKSLRVDGGASANNLLMQLQADYMGADVVRPQSVETTSMGAAYLAGLGVGYWKSLDEIKKVWKMDRTFASKMTLKDRKERLIKWQAAVKKAF